MDELDQLVHLYQSGTPIDIIAQALNMSPDGVKAALFMRSSKYRRDISTQARAGAPPVSTADEMLDIITEIARTSDNELTKLSAAKFARDDLKGRRDAIPLDAGINTNAFQFVQDRIAQLAASRRAFLEGGPKLVEISAEVTNG
jgi:hypothetical protein